MFRKAETPSTSPDMDRRAFLRSLKPRFRIAQENESGMTTAPAVVDETGKIGRREVLIGGAGAAAVVFGPKIIRTIIKEGGKQLADAAKDVVGFKEKTSEEVRQLMHGEIVASGNLECAECEWELVLEKKSAKEWFGKEVWSDKKIFPTQGVIENVVPLMGLPVEKVKVTRLEQPVQPSTTTTVKPEQAGEQLPPVVWKVTYHLPALVLGDLVVDHNSEGEHHPGGFNAVTRVNKHSDNEFNRITDALIPHEAAKDKKFKDEGENIARRVLGGLLNPLAAQLGAQVEFVFDNPTAQPSPYYPPKDVDITKLVIHPPREKAIFLQAKAGN